MIRPRTLRAAFAGAVLLTGMLAACAANDAAVDEAVAAGPALPAAAGQCYWLSDAGEGWLAQADLPDPEYCYELDSCSGGAGMSGGGCYKWAEAAGAPGTPWRDFGFPAMAQPGPDASGAAVPLSPPHADDIPPPKEIYEGSFEMTGDSCFENCPPVPVVLSAATPLFARPDASAPVVATFKADECVGNTDYKLLSAPRRGVVLEAYDTLVPGDVIYELAYEGEGSFSAWRRGEYLTLFYEGLAVRWDDPPAIVDPRVGYWLELERADGTSGWARDADVTFVEFGNGACPVLRP